MTGLAYPEISPIIFAIGPLAIRWYSMAYLIGIISAWLLVKWQVKKYNIPLTKENLDDLVFDVTMGIILGGRLGYVLFYGGEMFWEHPLQIFAIWNGGMSFHGGIVGVILAIWYFAYKVKMSFLSVTDLVVLYVPIGIFLGRLANFVNDELWGRVTDVAWAVRFPNGGYLPRHPSQIYEAMTEGVLMFVILNWLWHFKTVREHSGFVSGAFAFLYALCRLSMEPFREPDAQLGFIFAHVTMGQLLSVPFLIIGAWVMLRAFKPLK
ncbi:MAG: prolipoprotein diacylglyceryl transferase [Alphaproteobacteria bacterium]|nr:prolipoprotein diacylglyceryl transferase [Alphaproteobacteria bacterium]